MIILHSFFDDFKRAFVGYFASPLWQKASVKHLQKRSTTNLTVS